MTQSPVNILNGCTSQIHQTLSSPMCLRRLGNLCFAKATLACSVSGSASGPARVNLSLNAREGQLVNHTKTFGYVTLSL